MNEQIGWLIAWIGVYFGLILFVSYLSHRKSISTREDYFLASRSFGVIVLFAAILGTNLSSFAMLGAPGAAYHSGFGVYGMMSATAFCCFIMLLTIGRRLWKLGKIKGFQSPIQIFRERFQSDLFAILMFIVFVVFTGGYVVTGLIGGGIALESFTNGTIPYWAGTLAVLLIIAYYVMSGGMRSTAWTNVVQVAVFMIFLVGSLIIVSNALGGPAAAAQKLLDARPELLQRSGMPGMDYKSWFSTFLMFGVCLMVFPHILVRVMSANSATSLKRQAYLFPLGVVLTWIPSISLGIWGAVAIPGLEGKASDNIIPLMTIEFWPMWMTGFALVGILAMVMSSLDAQVLTVSHLFTIDILSRYFKDINEKQMVFYGRLIVAAMLIVAYIFALIQPGSLLQVVSWAFTGYAILLVPMVCGLFWKRANKWTANITLIWGIILLPLYYLNILPSWLLFGFQPIVPILASQVILAIVVTYLTMGQTNEVNDFYAVFERKKKTKSEQENKTLTEEIV